MLDPVSIALRSMAQRVPHPVSQWRGSIDTVLRQHCQNGFAFEETDPQINVVTDTVMPKGPNLTRCSVALFGFISVNEIIPNC